MACGPVLAAREHERGGQRRLARRARHEHALRPERVLATQHLVEQEGGREQRPQEHGQVRVRRLGRRAQVLVVDRGQFTPMRFDGREAATAGLGPQRVPRGHREEAEEPLARLHARDAGGDHAAEAPHRDASPPLIAGREERPVAQGFSEHPVGDVVGRQREALDVELHFT
jgi:hypothetical protein